MKGVTVILHHSGKLPSLDNNLAIKYRRNECQEQYIALGTFHKKPQIVALSVEYQEWGLMY